MKKYNKITCTALVIIIAYYSIGFSQIVKTGTIIFNPQKYSFSLSIPKGWVSDDQKGIKLGWQKVFYPAIFNFSTSPIIVYGKSVLKSDIATIKLQTEITIQEHINNGNYNYKIKAKDFIKIPGNKTCKIFIFSEDQWGNSEAIAYIEEKNTINYIVYNARTNKAFNQYFNKFKKIIKTYKNKYLLK